MSVIEKISPKIDTSIKVAMKELVKEESQVIIHLSYKAIDEDMLIRIWPTTFLFPFQSNHISDLLFVENISLHPQWTQVLANKRHTFTLIFKGLPKSCKFFDMLEVIPESGGFEFRNIERNRSDVYYLELE